MGEIIKTENVTKKYGKIHAVDAISLCVKKGEIYGFIGLNGAGKTTTIRMLLGLINPSSGTCWLNDKKVQSSITNIWDKVGYLVEIPYSYPELTVRENLEIIRRLRFISDPGSVDRVIEKLRLRPYQNMKAKHLSLGNAQRLGLAKAIIHNPEILILDEPANGLDPAGIVEIREMLQNLALNRGVTIFVSSHILGEVSKFATRIGIIHEGKLIQESNAEDIDRLRYRSLHVNTHHNQGAISLLSARGYSVSTMREEFFEVSGNEAITCPEQVASLLVQEGYPPVLIKVEEEELESYFLRMVGMSGGVK